MNLKVNQIKTRILGSSFIKSVLTLSSGTLLAQALSLLTTPIISRLFTTSEIGDFSVIYSTNGIITGFITLGLMTAIMIPKEDKKAQDICTILLVSVFSFTTLICGGMAILGSRVQFMKIEMDYSLACLSLWLFTILSTMSQIIYAYVNRQKLYRVMFWNPLIGGIVNAAVSIAAGLLGWGAFGYSLGNILAAMANVIHMLMHVRPFRLDLVSEKQTLKEHSRFIKYQWPANMISVFSAQMPVQMISQLFGSVIIGSYSMCMRMLQIPISLLAVPINRIYFREAAERRSNGQNIGKFTFKILANNIKIAIIPISILTVFGEPLFRFFLGAQWSQAGTMTAYLGINALMIFCSQCMSGCFVLIEKQNYELIFSAVNVIVIGGVFLMGFYLNFGGIYTVLFYSCTNVLLQTIKEGIFFHFAGFSVYKYIRFVVWFILFPFAVCSVLRLLMGL